MKVTIFTPAYNRAGTLDRLFESLRAQTCRDFEWLVVDDGSTDGTREKVASYSSDVPIAYVRQENRGKHVAHNRALERARGELFFTVDSDDELVPDALERILRRWPGEYEGVGGLCRDGSTGRTIGGSVRTGVVGQIELLRRRIYFELAGAWRTDVLRRFPFPEIEGIKFIPEGLVWGRLLRSCRMLLLDEVLEIKHFAADGFSRDLVRSYRKHPEGFYYYFLTNLRENGDLYRRHDSRRWLKDAVQLARMTFHAGRRLGDPARELTGAHRLAFWAGVPAGFLLYRRDLSASRG